MNSEKTVGDEETRGRLNVAKAESNKNWKNVKTNDTPRRYENTERQPSDVQTTREFDTRRKVDTLLMAAMIDPSGPSRSPERIVVDESHPESRDFSPPCRKPSHSEKRKEVGNDGIHDGIHDSIHDGINDGIHDTERVNRTRYGGHNGLDEKEAAFRFRERGSEGRHPLSILHGPVGAGGERGRNNPRRVWWTGEVKPPAVDGATYTPRVEMFHKRCDMRKRCLVQYSMGDHHRVIHKRRKDVHLSPNGNRDHDQGDLSPAFALVSLAQPSSPPISSSALPPEFMPPNSPQSKPRSVELSPKTQVRSMSPTGPVHSPSRRKVKFIVDVESYRSMSRRPFTSGRAEEKRDCVTPPRPFPSPLVRNEFHNTPESHSPIPSFDMSPASPSHSDNSKSRSFGIPPRTKGHAGKRSFDTPRPNIHNRRSPGHSFDIPPPNLCPSRSFEPIPPPCKRSRRPFHMPPPADRPPHGSFDRSSSSSSSSFNNNNNNNNNTTNTNTNTSPPPFLNCTPQPPINCLHPKPFQTATIKTWVCDVCNRAAFHSFKEACAHETACRGSHPPPTSPTQTPRDTSTSNNQSAERDVRHDDSVMRDDSLICGRSGSDHRDEGNDRPFLFAPIPLSVRSDPEWLSGMNCFLRRECIQAFSATEEDARKTSKRGRISPGRVGIRCAFCADPLFTEKTVAAVSYPVSICGIYESVKRLQKVHFDGCPAIPQAARERLRALSDSCARVPTTRQYWSDSARALGMVDTEHGIRFQRDPRCMVGFSGDDDARSATNRSESTLRALIRPEDEDVVPPYVYCLMEQVAPCIFNEADRFVARSKGPVGFPGFQCKHCSGHAGLGKYFPSSAKSLSTNSTSQNIHSHLMKCRKCPDNIKRELEILKDGKEKKGLSPGWRRSFFEQVWIRLHS